MISSQIKINKFSRRRTKATLLALSLATSMFWVSPQLPNHKAMACLPGLDDTAFVCKTVNHMILQAPLKEAEGTKADWLRALFLVLNLVIAGRMVWNGYQAWFRRKGDEEFQPKVVDINTKRGKS